MKNEWAIVLTSLVLVMAGVFSSAAGSARDPKRLESTLTPESELTDPKSLMDQFHNPWPSVTMGADIRLRYVFMRNVDTLDDNPKPAVKSK